MHVETVWNRLTRLVLILVMAAGALLVGVWYLPLIRQNQAMRERRFQLQIETQREEDRARQKRMTIESLRDDPRAVERLARERLGLARTGETVVHFEPAPASAAPSSR